MEKGHKKQSRRKFFTKTVPATIGAISGIGFVSQSCKPEVNKSEKVSLLSSNGEIFQVAKSAMTPVSPEAARQGIPGMHFVMVVDLSLCRNARKCIKVCEHHHQITPDRPYIKVLRMQDNEASAPYWMPKKCFHCDNPPCVKVCPVAATYKRSDGLVLIDNERCIGCRFCMAACPYSARVFNWGEPKKQNTEHAYSPETSIPSQIGTVEKCDFCPDMLRQNKLPHCITGCPNGALYFGDQNADSVTNGSETVRLSKLLKEKAGYRYHEELGTEPNVYYLPPADRLFPFKEALEGQPS